MGQSVGVSYVEGAGGVRLFVRDGGNPSGPAILFIHGYLFTSDVFSRQFDGALGETYRLVAMDFRGHGRSDKPDDIEAYLDPSVWADDVAAVIETLRLGRPVIVGWSMGSRIALNYGWRHGFEKIAGLNLVAAVVDGPTRGPLATLPAHLMDLLSPDEAVRLRTTKTFVRNCAEGGALTPEQEAAFVAEAMKVPVAARKGSRQWPIHYSGALSTLATPLLVTHGAGDPLVPEASSRELAARVPGGQLSVIGGGHLNFLQDPNRFDADLARFAAGAHAASQPAVRA